MSFEVDLYSTVMQTARMTWKFMRSAPWLGSIPLIGISSMYGSGSWWDIGSVLAINGVCWVGVTAWMGVADTIGTVGGSLVWTVKRKKKNKEEEPTSWSQLLNNSKSKHKNMFKCLSE